MQAAAVANQLTITADHPVAGNNDGDWIMMISLTYRARGVFLADALCNLAIGSGFPIGNALQAVPNAQPEGGAFWSQGEIEGFAFAHQIMVQLLTGSLQKISFFLNKTCWDLLIRKIEIANTAVIFSDADIANFTCIEINVFQRITPNHNQMPTLY